PRPQAGRGGDDRHRPGTAATPRRLDKAPRPYKTDPAALTLLSRRWTMSQTPSRREFVRDLGLGAAALPFVLNLPSLGFANHKQRKQRLVVMFSPNGVVPSAFWPDQQGEKFTLKEILKPLEPFQNQTLVLKGVCDKVRGDGDNHMRGIGCLLTGA